MVTIGKTTFDNQGDALSRDVPAEALALIDAGGNGGDRRYTYGDVFEDPSQMLTELHQLLA
jgi:hypothetical protein